MNEGEKNNEKINKEVMITIVQSNNNTCHSSSRNTQRYFQNQQDNNPAQPKHHNTLSLPLIKSFTSIKTGASSETLKKKYKISKGKSAKDIYNYYLNLKDKEEVLNEANIEKILKAKRIPKNRMKLYELYNISTNFLNKIKKIKNNREIAYKNDFKIEEYQDTLVKLFNGKISSENLVQMNQKFATLNERTNSNHKKFIHKGKWQLLAKKVENFAPKYLIDKFNSLGAKRANKV